MTTKLNKNGKMVCKRCGKESDSSCDVSVFQNSHNGKNLIDSNAQYVFLCAKCYRVLTNPMLTEPYLPHDETCGENEGELEQFAERMNQDTRY